MPSLASPLDVKHLKKAVEALLTHMDNRKTKGKAQLLDESLPVIVQVGTTTIPEGRSKPYMITLKHPMYDMEETQTCLIVKDPQREYKDKIAAQGITGIARVIGVSKLRNKFKQYEQQRQLCGTYDLFLADDRVLPLLPHLIGKVFFQKKKQPLPVNLQKGKWGEQFTRMLQSTPFYLSGGSCSSVKAGNTSMSAEQLVENIVLVIEKLATVLPKQWKAIQAIHIKTHDSIALPIYHSLPTPDTLALTAETGSKKRKAADDGGEKEGKGAGKKAKTGGAKAGAKAGGKTPKAGNTEAKPAVGGKKVAPAAAGKGAKGGKGVKVAPKKGPVAVKTVKGKAAKK